MIDIFLSRPTWVHAHFQPGLDGFIRMLKGFDLNPRTIGTTDQPRKAPLQEVIELLEKCKGAIVLGYPQITVSQGFVKDKQIATELFLATEWNHIEAGLAYARNLPLLVIHHVGLTRGIFDRGAMPSFLYERDLAQAHWPLEADLCGAVENWKDDCLNINIETKQADAHTLGKLTCPNCSTSKRLIYLSPIPPDFHDIENATHECTICHYKTK